MRRVVSWSKLVVLIGPHYPKNKTGRLPFPVATMLQAIHFMSSGVDTGSSLVHTVTGTASSVHDTHAVQASLHGVETDVYADAGDQEMQKRCGVASVHWHHRGL